MDPIEEQASISITPIRTHKGVCVQILDGIRLVFSLALLSLSIAAVFYSIVVCATLFPSSFPNWGLFILFFVALFLLGVTEGMHVACVQVAYRDFPSNYRLLYPNALSILDYQNQGNNLQHFLVGRQIVVLFCVFILGRVTTSDDFFGLSNISEVFVSAYIYSGFAGVILTVQIGQITPQIISSKYPLNYLNIWFIKYVFYFCIFLEQTGICYAVWLIGWIFFKITNNRKEISLRRQHGQANEHMRLKDDISGPTDDYYIKQQMLRYLDSLFVNNDNNGNSNETKNNDNDDDDDEFTNINVNELHPLTGGLGGAAGGLNTGKMKTMKKRKKFKGDNKTIQQAAQEFKDLGLEPPCFLKSLSDPDYVPPHLVALKLLENHVMPHQQHLTF